MEGGEAGAVADAGGVDEGLEEGFEAGCCRGCVAGVDVGVGGVRGLWVSGALVERQLGWRWGGLVMESVDLTF